MVSVIGSAAALELLQANKVFYEAAAQLVCQRGISKEEIVKKLERKAHFKRTVLKEMRTVFIAGGCCDCNAMCSARRAAGDTNTWYQSLGTMRVAGWWGLYNQCYRLRAKMTSYAIWTSPLEQHREKLACLMLVMGKVGVWPVWGAVPLPRAPMSSGWMEPVPFLADFQPCATPTHTPATCLGQGDDGCACVKDALIAKGSRWEIESKGDFCNSFKAFEAFAYQREGGREGVYCAIHLTGCCSGVGVVICARSANSKEAEKTS